MTGRSFRALCATRTEQRVGHWTGRPGRRALLGRDGRRAPAHAASGEMVRRHPALREAPHNPRTSGGGGGVNQSTVVSPTCRVCGFTVHVATQSLFSRSDDRHRRGGGSEARRAQCASARPRRQGEQCVRTFEHSVSSTGGGFLLSVVVVASW